MTPQQGQAYAGTIFSPLIILGAQVSAAQSPWGERSSFIQGVGEGGTGASLLPKDPGSNGPGSPLASTPHTRPPWILPACSSLPPLALV